MQKRTLGQGLEVSALSLGAMGYGKARELGDRDDMIKLLRTAAEQGMDYVTAGFGRVEREGGSIEEIRPATLPRLRTRSIGMAHPPTKVMTHAAVQKQVDGNVVDWNEHITDDRYQGNLISSNPGHFCGRPTRNTSCYPAA